MGTVGAGQARSCSVVLLGASPVPGWRHRSVGCSWSPLAPSAPGVKEGTRFAGERSTSTPGGF